MPFVRSDAPGGEVRSERLRGETQFPRAELCQDRRALVGTEALIGSGEEGLLDWEIWRNRLKGG